MAETAGTKGLTATAVKNAKARTRPTSYPTEMGFYSPCLFPSLRSLSRPMSDNTLNAALRRLGYAKDQMTAHGFRALAATLLNEMGIRMRSSASWLMQTATPYGEHMPAVSIGPNGVG